MHIQPHSHAHNLRRRGEASPSLLNIESALMLERKALIVSLGWIFYSKCNFKVSKSKLFPCGVSFFLYFWQKVYRSTLVPRPLPPCPKKILVAHRTRSLFLLAKRSILNIWQCSEYVCLDNCSVICTVTLCYVHIHNSDKFIILAYAELCWFRNMQAY